LVGISSTTYGTCESVWSSVNGFARDAPRRCIHRPSAIPRPTTAHTPRTRPMMVVGSRKDSRVSGAAPTVPLCGISADFVVPQSGHSSDTVADTVTARGVDDGATVTFSAGRGGGAGRAVDCDRVATVDIVAVWDVNSGAPVGGTDVAGICVPGTGSDWDGVTAAALVAVCVGDCGAAVDEAGGVSVVGYTDADIDTVTAIGADAVTDMAFVMDGVGTDASVGGGAAMSTDAVTDTACVVARVVVEVSEAFATFDGSGAFGAGINADSVYVGLAEVVAVGDAAQVGVGERATSATSAATVAKRR
jgi:hypothetical protein